MNKPSQCKCPFQLISGIYQCHISPCNPSVINHLQQRSHSHLGISEHAKGKVAALVILLMSLFIQIFTGLCLGERGTSVQTCPIMQIHQITARHQHTAMQLVKASYPLLSSPFSVSAPYLLLHRQVSKCLAVRRTQMTLVPAGVV